MRNPINSILCQNMKQAELATQLRTITENLSVENLEQSKKELIELSEQLEASNEIQFASSKMLNYFVNDMLTLAQIREGKFRKECSNFDIRVAIKEIMLIQKQKAQSLNINFTCKFVGFS